ncbi:MAG: polysaccharide deacetylase family protein [Alphaproteobacteria bacterium]
MKHRPGSIARAHSESPLTDHARRAIFAPLFALIVAAAVLGGWAEAVRAAPEDKFAAVVIMYHRFGATTAPSTNIRLDQFEAHLKELREGGYAVLPLPRIVTALADGEALPPRTVGISIDDAYLSAYTEAWPRLRAAGFPFTLFVATAPVDRKLKRYMSWDQVRDLAKAGVTIGSQTASHLHMATSTAGRNRADLAKSNQRFKAELGKVPELFAYPYGEASSEVMAVVREAGFSFAFGQHSGVLHSTADKSFLPRFAMNEAYGGIHRFRLAVNALPLVVGDITPADPLIRVNPPAFGFTVKSKAKHNLNRLACYLSGRGKLPVVRLGNRIEVRPTIPFPPGRARINCTLPGPDKRWRWFGIQLMVPKT